MQIAIIPQALLLGHAASEKKVLVCKPKDSHFRKTILERLF